MSEVEFKITGSDDGASKAVAGLRKEYAELYQALRKPIGQIEAFQKLRDAAKETGTEFYAARNKVATLKAALEQVKVPAEAMAASLAAAEARVKSSAAAMAAQKQKITEQTAAVREAKAAYDALSKSAKNGGATQGDLAGARSGVTASVAELNRQRETLRVQRRELAETRKQVATLGAEYDKVIEPVRILDRELNAAERKLASTTREFDRQKAALKQERRELQAAGIDTKNLAGELTRLKAASSGVLGQGKADALVSGSMDRLGVTRLRELKATLVSLEADYKRLTKAGVISANERMAAEIQYQAKVAQTKRQISEMTGDLAGAGGSGDGAGGAGGGNAGDWGDLTNKVGKFLAIAYTIKTFAGGYFEIVDALTTLEDRLSSALPAQEQFNEAQKELASIARRVRAPIQETTNLFIGMLGPLQEMGFSYRTTLKMVGALSAGLVASNVKGEQAAAVIDQLNKGLQTGVLRGDAFNAVLQNSPDLTKALTDGLKVSREELIRMANSGKLTTELIVSALSDQSDELLSKADMMKSTFGDATQSLSDSFGKVVKSIDDLLHISDLTVSKLDSLSDALDNLSRGRIAPQDVLTYLSLGNTFGALASSTKDVIEIIKEKLPEAAEESAISVVASAENAASGIKAADEKIIAEKTGFAARLEKIMKGVRKSLGAAGNEIGLGRAAAWVVDLQKDMVDSVNQSKLLEEKKLANSREYATYWNGIQEGITKSFKKSLEDQVKAQTKAGAELEKARNAQLETEKRYKTALEQLNGTGPSGEATYSNAQGLMVKARQSLVKNDTDAAKRQAQAALKVLMELQEAGENTYGFEGMIKSLQAIEQQADKINVEKAAKEFDEARDKTAAWKEELKELQDFKITPSIDDKKLAEMTDKLRDWAKMIGQDITIQPRLPDGSAATPTSALEAGLQGQGSVPVMTVKGDKESGTTQEDLSKYKQGDNSYGNQPVVEATILPKGITQDGNSYTNLPPVEVMVLPKGVVQAEDGTYTNIPPVPVEPKLDEDSAAQARADIAALAQQFAQQLLIPIKTYVVGSDAAGAESAPGFARGGILRGPGTGTSDSMLARLSNGEGILTARAVNYWGADMVHQLNRLQMPAFADGGVFNMMPTIPERSWPSLPPISPSLLQPAAANPEIIGDIYLNGPDGSRVRVSVPADQSKEFKKLKWKFGN